MTARNITNAPSGEPPVWRDPATDPAPADGTWFWSFEAGNAINVRWHDAFEGFVSSWREMVFAGGEGAHPHSPEMHEVRHWMPAILPAPKA